MPYRSSTVIPAPALVLAVIDLMLAAILAYVRWVALGATGDQGTAAFFGQLVSKAISLGVAGLLVVLSFAIARIAGAQVVGYASRRRKEATRLADERRHYREREEQLRLLADAMKREEDDAVLRRAS